jgi:putative ABC transport system permease protein
MFKHNLIVIYRNFKRYKATFCINLVGLSTGLTCALMIHLWIDDELHIDKYNNNDSQLFQVMHNETVRDGIHTETYTPGLLARTIASEMPEVEHAVAVVPPVYDYEGVLSTGNSDLKVKPQFADQEYFKVFALDFIQGDQSNALSDKSSVSISAATALRLFNTTQSIIGKTVQFKNQYFDGLYRVAGVFEQPVNSSVHFDVLFSYELFLDRRPEVMDWDNGGPSTLLTLRKGTDVDQFNEKITRLIRSKGRNAEESLFLQRFSQRYLHNNYENGRPAGGRVWYVYLFSSIAFFILFIACINFVNLFTANAYGRMKEVGIKKAIGASRQSLIIQFLGESLLTVFISMGLAVLFAALLLSHFNEITSKQLHLHLTGSLIGSILGIGLFTVLAAGSYPAIYISGFNPVAVLKGKLKNSLTEVLIRKGLVVFQFTISVILILCVVVIHKQIQYIQTKNPGYNRNNIIAFVREGKIEANYQAFIAQVGNIATVEHASYLFGNLTGGASSRSGGLFWEGQSPMEKQTSFAYLDVDYDLIETLGIEIVSGRSFSRDFGTDSSAIIFNEAAIKTMGLKNPVGKRVNFYGNRQIIGVVRDFQFESVHEKVKPFFFKLDAEPGGNILVKIKPGAERATIQQIERLYKQFNPGFPFEYKFLDESFKAQYLAEQRVSVLSRYFALLAILISCLGLFGLAAFTAEKRRKEIGVRKVLGASTIKVVQLLSGEFARLVLISIAIALPLGYMVVKHWLNDYAYRIDLEWIYFISTALGALVIAWLTVALQALKAAKMNPAESLRNE